MAGTIFGSLQTGYTGLQVNQQMVDTTSHNLANSNNDHYTRQRVVASAMEPLAATGLEIGQGSQYTRIVRVHDEFKYDRYKSAGMDKEQASLMKDTLEEVSKLFPELQDVGIRNDLDSYFDAWNSLTTNPTSTAEKVAVVEAAKQLAYSISTTRENLFGVQVKLNDQLDGYVSEINNITESLAHLTAKINVADAQDTATAADLRDQRDELEIALNKLVNMDSHKGTVESDSRVDGYLFESGEQYNLNISGFSVVEASQSHELTANSKDNEFGFYDINYVRKDWQEFSMSTEITGGKVGAILDLRGRTMNQDGTFDDGIIQGYIDDLDTFARGLMEATNSLYAAAPQERMESQQLSFKSDRSLLANQDVNVNYGTFNINVYDADGTKVSTKEITFDENSSMASIVKDINANTDDNGDNSPTNDFDDEFSAKFINGYFIIDAKNPSKNYTISIEDNGTNFAGALGLSRLFEGHSAQDIKVASEIDINPSSLKASTAAKEGGNEMANAMMQLQYDDVTFRHPHKAEESMSLSEYFRQLTSKVNLDGEMANTNYDTKETLYVNVKQEYAAVSQVSVDEELTNLMRFQTGYQANAKVVTTIDKMMDTLLGLKS
jgi:flagellar hook-associated protein 1 FlgK